MTSFMIGGFIFVFCIVMVGVYESSLRRNTDTEMPDPTEILPEYQDDDLLGLGKGFNREIIEITDESITYADPVTSNHITVSEPILQFVREVKTRVNTFRLIPRGDDYCGNGVYIRGPYDYTIEDTLTGKSFKFSVENGYVQRGKCTTSCNSLDVKEGDWITKEEKRYLYSVLYDEFYVSRKNKLKGMQSKRKRDNMKRLYRKEAK